MQVQNTMKPKLKLKLNYRLKNYETSIFDLNYLF